MSTIKCAIKRKISDKSTVESNTKKRRIEERCYLEEGPMNEPDSSVVFNSYEHISIRKIRQKLSSILHYEKKYKYFCKKHNVLYLIQKTRKTSRELSKKSRDHLVNSLRSLDLTEDFPGGKQSMLNSEQLMSDTMDAVNDDEENLFNYTESDSLVQSKIIRIFVTSDENEFDAHNSESDENVITKHQTTNQLTLSKMIHHFILCEDSDDSDYDIDDREKSYESSTDGDYCVTKSPGGNIIMKKVSDTSRVNEYLCCNRRNCLHDQYFRSRSKDLDSSFDSESFDGLFTG